MAVENEGPAPRSNSLPQSISRSARKSSPRHCRPLNLGAFRGLDRNNQGLDLGEQLRLTDRFGPRSFNRPQHRFSGGSYQISVGERLLLWSSCRSFNPLQHRQNFGVNRIRWNFILRVCALRAGKAKLEHSRKQRMDLP